MLIITKGKWALQLFQPWQWNLKCPSIFSWIDIFKVYLNLFFFFNMKIKEEISSWMTSSSHRNNSTRSSVRPGTPSVWFVTASPCLAEFLVCKVLKTYSFTRWAWDSNRSVFKYTSINPLTLKNYVTFLYGWGFFGETELVEYI